MKKIIFSSFDDMHNPYYGGGGALSIHEIAKRLSKKNKVTVITGKYPGSKDVVIDKVHYKRIGISSISPQLGQLIFQLLLPFQVIKYRKKFDIWVENFTPPFSTAFLPLFTTKPVVGLVHLLGAKDMSKKYHLPFTPIENLGLKTYRYFIALNTNIKETIASKNPKSHIELIPNGIDSKLLKVKLKKQKKHVLFIGRIDLYQKGLDLLLESYKDLRNDANMKLLIAGSGEAKHVRLLKEKIKEYKLTNKVEYIGKISGKKKQTILSKTALLVLPSRYETQPLTLLEAFYLGIPVVTYDIRDLSWLDKKYCIKIKPFKTKEFGLAILDVLKNGQQYQPFVDRAKGYAKQFNWDSLEKKYSLYINRLV